MKFFVQTLFLLIPFLLSAQWSQKQLDEAKFNLASKRLGTTLVYAGGTADDQRGSDYYDLYDFMTGEFTTAEWPGGGHGHRVGGNDDWAIYFGATGTRTTATAIYFKEDDRWETDDLLDSRIGMNFTTFGDEAFFFDPDRFGAERIDILNVRDETWREGSLPFDREDRTSFKVGNKLFLIGGLEDDLAGFLDRTTAVDVYNLETGQWEFTELTEGRTDIAVTLVGDKIYAAGGFKNSNLSDFGATKTMDIIDVNDLSVTSIEMPEVNADFEAHTIDKKVILIGGFSPNGIVYDTETGIWSEEVLTTEDDLKLLKGKVLGQKLYAHGALDDLDKVFIYDADNNSWGEHILDTPRSEADINTVGNQLLIAGGRDQNRNPVNIVDIFTDTSLVVQAPLSLSVVGSNVTCPGFTNGLIIAQANGGIGTYEYYLNNDFDNRNSTGIFSDLGIGTYIVNVIDEEMNIFSTTFEVSEPTPITYDLEIIPPTVAGNDGSVCITNITGGMPPYNISLPNGQTGNCQNDLSPGNYSIIISDELCSVCAKVTIPEFSGTSDLVFDSNLKVFPNPSKKGFLIESNQLLSKVSIIDLVGKRLKEQTINTKSIFIQRGKIVSGNYFILIENDKGEKQIEHVIFE